MAKNKMTKLLAGLLAAAVTISSSAFAFLGNSNVFAAEKRIESMESMSISRMDANALKSVEKLDISEIDTDALTGRFGFIEDVQRSDASPMDVIGRFEGTSFYDQLDEYSQDAYVSLENEYKNGMVQDAVNIPIGIVFPTEDSSVAIQYTWLYIILPACLALGADHPEYSWLSAVSYGVDNVYGGKNSAGNIVLTSMDIQLSSENIYGTPAEMNAAVAKAKTAIGTKDNDYDQLKAIHDYLCDTVDYNFVAVGATTPQGYDVGYYQSAYSAFYKIPQDDFQGSDKNLTVCAGYAKSFKVLCDSYGITCIVVQGYGINNDGHGEAHAWNYVKMEDGKWYAVDVTWDDQEQKIYYEYFLAGKNTPGFNNQTFGEGHSPSGLWLAGDNYFEFKYPNLSDIAYEPEEEEETTPEETTPEETTPEATTPEETTPEATTPEETTPEATTPEETTPEETTPEVTTPEETTPEATTPEETTPEATTPEETTPEATTPEETTPEATTPEETTPEATTPEETTPEATTPEETTPEATTPEETTPEATTPEETTPEATTPEATTPEETTPEATTPEETRPISPDPPYVGVPVITSAAETTTTTTAESAKPEETTALNTTMPVETTAADITEPEPANTTASDTQPTAFNTTVQQGENAPEAQLADDVNALYDAVLSAEEKEQADNGAEVKLILSVDELSDSVSSADKNAVESAVSAIDPAKGTYKIGCYLNISLSKQVGGQQTSVTETVGEIAVTLDIPASLRNIADKFAVIRVHGGKADFLEDIDNDPNTVTFKSDRFSTYAIIYSANKSADSTEDKIPNTANELESAYLFMAVAAVSIISCSAVSLYISYRKKSSRK